VPAPTFNAKEKQVGFNLKMMFDELFEILASDKKDSKKVKELTAAIAAAKKYAEECGQLR
jgi:hypothetical protein